MIQKFVNEALKGKSATTVKSYTHALKQFEQWLDGVSLPRTFEPLLHSLIRKFMLSVL
ncbi:hypothetical protein [Bacillus mycoides]|uniref:Core-binding (CB) domain-containing protein n=1 Tax=Bacillus mycoides TaxID=1405 RepID=A0ABC9QWR2_BACMY|nr:hypothetical protein [Bacillus mycoides]EJR31154.1 hypothetical protein III_05380 [Bacillus mycoides]